MTEEWQVADEEQDEDDVNDALICMNGNACDHPWCPEHGEPEDSNAGNEVEQFPEQMAPASFGRKTK